MNEQPTLTEKLEILAEDSKTNERPWELWEVLFLGGWERCVNINMLLCNPEQLCRKIDPYRELKEAAKDPTKQIRCGKTGPWYNSPWSGWAWNYPPEEYEIRDKPKEKVLRSTHVVKTSFGVFAHTQYRTDEELHTYLREHPDATVIKTLDTIELDA